MRRTLVIESSDSPRIEIDYAALSLQDIESRIHAHEMKYGMTFSQYSLTYRCDNASPDETTDYMDWEFLILEITDRLNPVEKKD